MSEPQVVSSLPQKRTHKVNWSAVTSMARANPGEWVLVPVELNKSMASQIRAGRYPSVDPNVFEVATRVVDPALPHRVRIWVRTK